MTTAKLRQSGDPQRRPPPAVGIDLGTTYSVIAALDELGHPRTLPNSEGDRLTPSAVLFEGDTPVVGREALRAMATEPHQVAVHAKRAFGRREFPRVLGGRRYPPEAIQAWVLNKLRNDATPQIGRFHQVVITVPAYFDDARRRSTIQAGYIAGLEVLEIINEPTAAALAFAAQSATQRAETTATPPQNLVVYDLGGGTFDVTVLENLKDQIVTLATDGDAQLGGYDWDQRIVEYVAEQFQKQFRADPREDPVAAGRLWRACEDAKQTLSVRAKAVIPCDYRGQVAGIELTRETFEAITSDLVERTRFTLLETIQASGLRMEQLHALLLVGGSSRIPAIQEMLKAATGLTPTLAASPDEIVAHGAALRAGMILRDPVKEASRKSSIRNVNAHSLGVAGTDLLTKQPRNAILIPRNTQLPASARKVFQTQRDDQRTILVPILEGESANPAECASVGQCVVRDLPPGLPAHSPVEVSFFYAADGTLEVDVKLTGWEKTLSFSLDRPNGLDRSQLDAWRLHIANIPAE
jgi:molecular chaperone DnaK